MIFWLTVLLSCQLVGEAIAAATNIGIPGPVCGMVLLFLGLLIYGRVPQELNTTSETLLSNLSVLFVPAGVGVMLHFKLLASDWLPLSVALIVSTALTIAVSGTLMSVLGRKASSESEPPAQEASHD